MGISEGFRKRSRQFWSYAPEGLSEALYARLRITREPDSAGFKQWSIDVEHRISATEDGGIDSPVREKWEVDPNAPAWSGLSAEQVLDIAIDAAGQTHGRLLKEFLGLSYMHEWDRKPAVPPVNPPMPGIVILQANDNLAARLG